MSSVWKDATCTTIRLAFSAAGFGAGSTAGSAAAGGVSAAGVAVSLGVFSAGFCGTVHRGCGSTAARRGAGAGSAVVRVVVHAGPVAAGGIADATGGTLAG